MATATYTTIKNEMTPPSKAELAFLEKKNLDEEKKSLVGEALNMNELGKELRAIKLDGSETVSAHSQVPTTPTNPFYEILQTPCKGISIFAKAPIPRGTLILAEKPLMRVTKAHYMAEHVEEAVEKLTTKDKKKYWSLASAHGQDKSLCVMIFLLLLWRLILIDYWRGCISQLPGISDHRSQATNILLIWVSSDIPPESTQTSPNTKKPESANNTKPEPAPPPPP